MNSVITAHSLVQKPSSKVLMGQISREMNPNIASGRLRYNLRDYIRQKGIYEKGMRHLRTGRNIRV